jgi:hypothetical protein
MLRHAALLRTRRNIPEDAILHSYRRENLKSYIIYTCFIGLHSMGRQILRFNTVYVLNIPCEIRMFKKPNIVPFVHFALIILHIQEEDVLQSENKQNN